MSTDPREVIAQALHSRYCQFASDGRECSGPTDWQRREADRALADLSAAGWTLLPPGGNQTIWWGVRQGTRVEKVGGGLGSELLARMAAQRGEGAQVRRETRVFEDGSEWIGPWMVVTTEEDQGG